MAISGLPSTQTAVVARKGHYAISATAPIPPLEADSILIRTEAVAINPVDLNAVMNFDYDGTVGGFDVAGTVLAVGSAVDNGLREGDRVGATVHGMNPLRPADGAFAQYVVTPADLAIRVPADTPIESAATLAVGVGTVGLALRSLGLDSALVPGPDGATNSAAKPSKPLVVLVHGGSTATGTLALQFLRHAGHTPIATCSPHNFELVRKAGAEKVFDYRSESCTADIRSHTRNSLRYVLDCISETSAMEFSYGCIGRAGGRYTALHPFSSRVAASRPTIKADWVFQPALFGREVGWPSPFGRAGDAELRGFARAFYRVAQETLEKGELRPHPVSVSSETDGFAGVIAAVDQMREGVSGVKLVCRVLPDSHV
ncbi:zinc-binding alcohol dehydrogenase family protein [Aspergillus foveolatus]|uniref:zinc-binding alcohol dehydrogenase family protein n=1 Tax=Aspergillus foveolatus TaxID=210207 RepID=UPI003CCD3E5D